MELELLLQRKRKIRAIGFDDAPFIRGSKDPVNFAGVVCAGTRFEGMLWGEVEADGWDSTDRISQLLLNSKFLPQLHIVLLDGICLGGFNVIELPKLADRLGIPCVSVMRKMPDMTKIDRALTRLPQKQKRLEIIRSAGSIHQYPPFYFQVCGASAPTIADVLTNLTNCGNVPEALRLAHLIGSAIIKGESGDRA